MLWPTEPRRTGSHFTSLRHLCEVLGASIRIDRLLIANNGLAAVKGIDSIRSWLYDHIGDMEAIQMVVMATPEDLKANAEFIAMANQHVVVPGGPSSSNYANVELILHTALQNTCDAIYPGWGHASENPALPHECDRSRRVIFLGPSSESMFTLGDKIASTIVAQSNGVPTVPWSGDHLRLPPAKMEVDTPMYNLAFVTTAEACLEVCQRIGFPVMIKASEGGGGKGIRCCTAMEEVKDLFSAVKEEVQGCHIFVMKMLQNVRHLEVQLLADSYGNCIAVRTRDCSVQRRHQKIIEEGPVVGVSPHIIDAMEAAAIQLATATGYRGLGTVEFMYDRDTHQFFFLELNPRIQVEHPVSEMITGVNLPAALLCVGMGIRLDRIPEVRAYFGEDPYGTSVINFRTATALRPKCHTIAVRVTAEDTDAGFSPTSGTVEEIAFKNSKECWGYFSIGSGGEIHQYADSQFGHIFSSGATREEARRGMVMALRSLVIRGEIRNSSSYVLELLETPEFRTSSINTAWLDGLIAQRRAGASVQPSLHVALIAASIFRSEQTWVDLIQRYGSFLEAGHIPSTDYLNGGCLESYIHRSEKFTIHAGKMSPTDYAVTLNGSTVLVPFRMLKSGALQLTVGAKTVVAYVEKDPNSLRITVAGKVINLTGDRDPTQLFASVPGRLVRFVVDQGDHLLESDIYAEVEVMKMILPLRATATGRMQHRAVPGSTIAVGTLLAEILPDDPTKLARPTEHTLPWPREVLSDRVFVRLDGVHRAVRAADGLWNLLQGYHGAEVPFDARLTAIFEDFSSLFLSSVALKDLRLPFLSQDRLTDPAFQSPTGKQLAILDAIITNYVEVERHFDNRTRQEAMEQLRERCESSAEVFQFDYAHHQECHHDVIKGILSYVESNNVLLKSMKQTLSKLVQLRSYTYGPLLLQARYLIRQCALPSLTERKAMLVQELESGSLTDLLQGDYSYDLLGSIMFDRQAAHLTQVCLELFLRREHSDEQCVVGLDIFRSGGNWFATYAVEVTGEEGQLMLHSPGQPAVEPQRSAGDERVTGGLAMVFAEASLMFVGIVPALEKVLQHRSKLSYTATIFFSVSRKLTQEMTSLVCHDVLTTSADALRFYPHLRTIFFVVHGMPKGPHMFTFHRNPATNTLEEATLLRNVFPQSTRRLELDRLSNFHVSMYPTPFRDVHLFRAVPRRSNPTAEEHRMFARVAVTPRDMGMKPWSKGTEVDAGHMLAKCLSALEVAHDDPSVVYPASNHVFVKLIELTFDVGKLQDVVAAAASSYQKQLMYLGVTEVELAFQVLIAGGLLPMRVIVTSPSGYGVYVHVYYEQTNMGVTTLHRADTAHDVVVGPIPSEQGLLVDVNPTSPSSPSPSQASSGLPTRTSPSVEKLIALRHLLPTCESEYAVQNFNLVMPEGKGQTTPKVLGPYPELSSQSVRRLRARAAQTTYCHDWPILLSLLVRKEWRSLAQRADDGTTIPIPAVPLVTTQLFLGEDGQSLSSTSPSSSPCGVVVWRVDYQPAKYYQPEHRHDSDEACPSRSFILVANDITHQAGSFAVEEDRLFHAAGVRARQEGIPFVFISANSGARLGLCREVQQRFRAAFTSSGELDYLYLTAEDYVALTSPDGEAVELEAEERRMDDGEVRYLLKGIVGKRGVPLGVENLQGSGLVAGTMSANYAAIPTISLVSGRSVGIGAYLNRLGRRIIQSNDAPLLLTGAKALNRLLGKEVYLNNGQLGGKQVMVANGVTHWSARTDYGAAKTLLLWLDYVPASMDTQQIPRRLLHWPVMDPIDREVSFCPEPGQAYDPRWLITGGGLESSGMFDRGSWMEAMEGWAKSVVTGRATLGGIPCGVIVVETRQSKKFAPADPADPTSACSFVDQAGQVWFPDSARKTADALDDFHHERLPCFILANWRGFSGGMRDMFDEVLKFGASIVDNLRIYSAPLFIHVVPHGELRGGAWVVVDPSVNHHGAAEMSCDPTARGGVLEPAGTVEVRFREKDIEMLIRRQGEWPPEGNGVTGGTSNDERKALQARYRDVALRFADLHDTALRMQAVGVVQDVIPWHESRRRFYHKLQRKLTELSVAEELVAAGSASGVGEAVASIQKAYVRAHPRGPSWGMADEFQLSWLQQHRVNLMARRETPQTNLVDQLRQVDPESRNELLMSLLDDPEWAAAARCALHRKSEETTNHIASENLAQDETETDEEVEEETEEELEEENDSDSTG